MSLQGRNRAIYSYNNANRRYSNFMYNNIDKANCYKSDFRNTIFDGTSLRATKIYSIFENVIFIAVNADGAKFKGGTFFTAFLMAF